MHTELFALHVGLFMIQKYAHLDRVFVDIERLKWSRIGEHPHSFVRDGDEKSFVRVEASRSFIAIFFPFIELFILLVGNQRLADAMRQKLTG